MSLMAAVTRELIAAGLEGEALIAAIGRIEQSIEPVKSSGAKRTARWRERHKTSQSVTVTLHPSPSPPSSDGSPTPLPITLSPTPSTQEPPSLRSAPTGGNTRGKRLALDWQPTPDDCRFAEVTLGHANWMPEIEKFRDYWHARAGPGAVKIDWRATWRNWIRKAYENGRNGRLQTAKPNGIQEALRRRLASFDADGNPGSPPAFELLPGGRSK